MLCIQYNCPKIYFSVMKRTYSDLTLFDSLFLSNCGRFKFHRVSQIDNNTRPTICIFFFSQRWTDYNINNGCICLIRLWSTYPLFLIYGTTVNLIGVNVWQRNHTFLLVTSTETLLTSRAFIWCWFLSFAINRLMKRVSSKGDFTDSASFL